MIPKELKFTFVILQTKFKAMIAISKWRKIKLKVIFNRLYNNILENPNHKQILVTAGGDGSLVGIVMRAKTFGVDVTRIACCPQPYGTGNDLCRVLNWGGEPTDDFHSSVK